MNFIRFSSKRWVRKSCGFIYYGAGLTFCGFMFMLLILQANPAFMSNKDDTALNSGISKPESNNALQTGDAPRESLPNAPVSENKVISETKRVNPIIKDDMTKPKKVLFVTLSRSGSSFLGELINRNKAGFYHFEPLFGIYSALYGVKFGMSSMAVFKNKATEEDRWPPFFEAEFVAQQMADLLDCNLDRLSVEVLQDRFSMQLNKEKQFNKYKTCLKTVPKSLNGTKGKPFKFAHECKTHVDKKCGSFYDGKREINCFENIYGVPYPLPNDTIHNHIFEDYDFESQLVNAAKPATDATDKAFTQHNQCVLNALNKSNQCLDKLLEPCRQSSVRGAKVIRMRMENVAQLLAKSPDIKVVHYFRDPRGLELSRSVGMKPNIQESMINDAKLTCRKMQQDIDARKELEKLYPNSFMVLKYEDLATNTQETAEQLYDFIGAEMPPEVSAWLKESTNSTSKDIHNGLGTSRKNSTETAIKWRTKMPKSTALEIGRICKDILEELGYEL